MEAEEGEEDWVRAGRMRRQGAEEEEDEIINGSSTKVGDFFLIRGIPIYNRHLSLLRPSICSRIRHSQL